VKGNKMLYDFCERKELNHSKCGKLVVATNSEEEKILQNVLNQSIINGVRDGRYLTREEAREVEPEIYCTAALYFPSTGIIDTHGLMKELECNALNNNVSFAYNSEVITIDKLDEGYAVTVYDGIEAFTFTTEYIINSAGLQADKIAKLAGAYHPDYQIHFWKGDYFAIGNGKNKKIKHLIYPVPQPNSVGLGVHATIDLNNGVKLGPDATYLASGKIDYSVNITKKSDFYQAALKYLPFLELEDLHPDQSGIRPKLQQPGDSVRDFIIKRETEKGHPNFINLIGIESPGLTSCLSISRLIASMIND
jgi:L-2-hydroxyglutarate oxidase LhgO